jgi:hypothetical protein
MEGNLEVLLHVRESGMMDIVLHISMLKLKRRGQRWYAQTERKITAFA